jgi:hypothetical protein
LRSYSYRITRVSWSVTEGPFQEVRVTRWFFDVRFLFFSAYVLVCLIWFSGVTFLAPFLGISTHVKLWMYWMYWFFSIPESYSEDTSNYCLDFAGPVSIYSINERSLLSSLSPFPEMDLSYERLFMLRVHVVERMEIMSALCCEHGATHVLRNDCGKLSCLFKHTETCKRHNSSHSGPTKASQ